MAILIDADMGDENEVMCSECDAVFTVIFRRSATCSGIVYCPFCGDEIVDETTADDEHNTLVDAETHYDRGTGLPSSECSQ